MTAYTVTDSNASPTGEKEASSEALQIRADFEMFCRSPLVVKIEETYLAYSLAELASKERQSNKDRELHRQTMTAP